MLKIFPKIFAGSIYFILYLPILILALYSFNNSSYSLTWHGYTLKWYLKLFQDLSLWQALINSLSLALLSSSIATLMALNLAIFLFINKNQNYKLFNLIYMMIIIPDLVLGIALIIFFNFLHLELGFISLFIAHLTLSLPFAIMVFSTRIKTLNPNLYWSALDLGASPLKAYVAILIPLFSPSILSAFLLSFTLSFDDVMISYFVSGPSFELLPLKIYSLVRIGITPELNALCTIILLFSIALIIAAYKGLRE